MKKLLAIIILALMIIVPRSVALERLYVDVACSYYGENIIDNLYGFTSDNEAEKAVGRIVDYTGLSKNFKILAANVPNAAAAIRNTERLILYNQTFMERVKQRTRTDWAAMSILAHEIGHHLCGHTLESGGSRPKSELEADKYSGHVLYKMGAKLSQAQAAMNAIANDKGSNTHPPKSARLAAIANGWMDARDQARLPEQPQKSQDEKYPDTIEPRPERQELRKVAICRFIDGGIFYLMADGRIMKKYMGTWITVARKANSNDTRFDWIYERMNDPSTEMYFNLMGVSSKIRYGVDRVGKIWVLLFGDWVSIGQVEYF